MHRFYASHSLTADTVALSKEDEHHARNVLRLADGDTVEIVFSGTRYLATLHSGSGGLTACLGSPLPTTEPIHTIDLFQGLPKGDKMDMIVQKAVELGAGSVTPLIMERCVTRLDDQSAAKKQARWQRIAYEAGKQSGRVLEVPIHLPLSFRHFLDRIAEYDAVLVPYEMETTLSLRCAVPADAMKIAVVIGPEGGISEQEISDMAQHGAHAVTLGPRILRTETAGLCALSCLMCLLGEMDGGRGA